MFYYIRNDKDGLNEAFEFIKILKNDYEDLAIFQPSVCELGCDRLAEYENKLGIKTYYLFKETQAYEKYLEDENEFFKEIILKYQELAQKHKHIFVMNFNEFGIFNALFINLQISKHLNLSVLTNSKAISQYAQKFNIKTQSLNEYKTLQKSCFLTPIAFKIKLENLAKKDIKTIVLPEGDDDRILLAASKLLESKAVKLIILGNNQEIAKKASELDINLDDVKTINPGNSQYDETFANALYEARKTKGLELQKAKELIKDKNYFGTMLVHLGYADAMVSGATCTTADTIRPALQIVKTKPNVSSVSGGFFMCLEDRVLYFADCAVTPNPSPEDLAQIAKISALTAQNFGFKANVAMLSYSSANSGSGPSVDATKQACELAKAIDGLNVDGPMQFDCAVDLKTAKSKMPDSKVAANANVFIFPDLNAANICYKAVQRCANAVAIGPILQGLNKPINDLSRGCLVEDIVNTCLISAIQAQ